MIFKIDEDDFPFAELCIVAKIIKVTKAKLYVWNMFGISRYDKQKSTDFGSTMSFIHSQINNMGV